MRPARFQTIGTDKVSFVRLLALAVVLSVTAVAIYVSNTYVNESPIAEKKTASQLRSSNWMTTVSAEGKSDSGKQSPALSKLSLVSCAACHGAHSSLESSGAENDWQSAYQIWARQDPHANAYVSLWNKQSKKIVAALAKRSGGSPSAKRSALTDHRVHQAIINEQCVSCHSTVPVSMSSQSEGGHDSRGGGLLLSGGVSCLSCHSREDLDEPTDQSWIVAHTLEEWSAKDAQQKLALGLQDLSQQRVRAQTCLKCHVGSPGREVNHDLIAAGHPRLVFEYSSHLSRLPAHWQEKADPEFNRNCWSVGQTEAAISSLKQLSNRSRSAVRAGESDGSQSTAHASSWPELSEYNCHNCHHDLQNNWYQENDNSVLGQTVWGTWAFPRHAESTQLAMDLAVVRKEMESPIPDAKKVLQVLQEIEPAVVSNFELNLGTKHIYSYLRNEPRLNSDELFAWYLAADCVVRDFPLEQQAKRNLAVAALIDLKEVLDRPFQSSSSNQNLAPITATAILEKVSRVRDLVLPVDQQKNIQ